MSYIPTSMTYLKNSRRNFLKGITATSVLSATAIPAFTLPASGNDAEDSASSGLIEALEGEGDPKPALYDGPASSLFDSISFKGNSMFPGLNRNVSERMSDASKHAPTGDGTAWGIPFKIPSNPILIIDNAFSLDISPIEAKWCVFLHTSDFIKMEDESGMLKKPFKGPGFLNEEVAQYFIVYSDGTEEMMSILERHQIGMFRQGWGENSIQSVAQHKPTPVRAHHEQMFQGWGGSQTRVNAADRSNWINWVWAWENPYPEKQIAGFRFESKISTPVIISAISYGNVSSNPLRWQSRQKAVLTLQGEDKFNPVLSEEGLLSQVQLDMGQVISATPKTLYPEGDWADSYNNKVPELSGQELIIEYTAHPEAAFHLTSGVTIPISEVRNGLGSNRIKRVKPARQNVKLRILEKGTRNPVAVKLHVHGESGEYLAPVDRHRIPNNAWFEDYSVDFVHAGIHVCTYIAGEAQMKLPFGKVYLEVSKGFEIKPMRMVLDINADTDVVEIEIEKVLSWREKGWVSADTHVHFLSPNTALLEGSAEGVNIVNLLASQWGELFTNIGDFDGKTTIGSKEAGGDGEYLVRVGTENRQHVLGHISLLGYRGEMIAPLTTGGPDESALGDPIEILLTEWAEICKKQDGVVVLPHFPNPRMENAAAIVSGNIDGVEMTSWGNLYGGISPYSLSDWYRYLNCGYFVAAVGGTDKMSAGTAVGTIRTYARIRDNRDFTYDEWKEAIRSGYTFVSFGPLLNFTVDGKPMGSKINMTSSGGTVDISWEVASVTIPTSRVELVVNGEITESVKVSPDSASGNWSVRITKSSWYALLVRGHYPDKPEIITAHSSPVMVFVEDSQMMAAADALTILEQIEGAMAYLDTIGTRAEEKRFKRMRLVLETQHRALHNRMHQLGHYHRHSPLTDHPGHEA